MVRIDLDLCYLCCMCDSIEYSTIPSKRHVVLTILIIDRDHRVPASRKTVRRFHHSSGNRIEICRDTTSQHDARLFE